MTTFTPGDVVCVKDGHEKYGRVVRMTRNPLGYPIVEVELRDDVTGERYVQGFAARDVSLS